MVPRVVRDHKVLQVPRGTLDKGGRAQLDLLDPQVPPELGVVKETQVHQVPLERAFLEPLDPLVLAGDLALALM